MGAADRRPRTVRRSMLPAFGILWVIALRGPSTAARARSRPIVALDYEMLGALPEAIESIPHAGTFDYQSFCAYTVALAYSGKFAIRTPINDVTDECVEPVHVEYLPDGRSVSHESSFGWHDVDTRTPLPSLAELHVLEHPIGVRDGRQFYLCTATKAMKFGTVERSAPFSEHYGVHVYLCQRS